MSFVPSAGTTLSVKQTSEGSMTSVGCITEVSLDRGTRPSSTTACIATSTKFKRPGITEPGSASFSVEFDHQSTMHIWLAGELGQAVNACTRQWQIAYPANNSGTDEDTATDTFDGFVSAFTVDASDVDGPITGQLTIELVSLPVLATVAAG